MGKLARGYYQELAERLDIGNVPPALSGASFALSANPDSRISIHSPDEQVIAEVTSAYEEVLVAAGAFALRAAGTQHETIATGVDYHTLGNNTKHVNSFVEQGLFPSNLKLGTVKDFRVEAIAGSQVDPKLRARAIGIRIKDIGDRIDVQERDSEAYLLASAALISGGRKAGRTGLLAVVGVAVSRDYNGATLTPRYMGIRLPTNDKLAASALWESQATRYHTDVRGLEGQIVQPVGRGRRS